MDDLGTVFLEFSKLFFNDSPNLQLANFLHLVTLSVQSGSVESEIEAMLSSQGIGCFPEDDNKWAVIDQKDAEMVREEVDEIAEGLPVQRVTKARKPEKSNEWPPRSFQQRAKNLPTRTDRILACKQSLDSVLKEIETKKSRAGSGPGGESLQFNDSQDCILGSTRAIAEIFHQVNYASTDNEEGCETLNHVNPANTDNKAGVDRSTSADPSVRMGNHFSFSDREQLSIGVPNEQQQFLTGRLGEAVVYNHLLEKHGAGSVKWMNAESESGFPSDIVIDGNDGQKVLVEVKTTWSEDKDWFEISCNEWEMASKVGERYIIIRVFLGSNSASPRFLWLPNLSKLCQDRVIKLALVLPQNS
jgi:hypothetical protein